MEIRVFDEEQETPQQKAIREIRERRQAAQARRRPPASRARLLLVFVLLSALIYFAVYML